MVAAGSEFDSIVKDFKWEIPDNFNIAWAICGRHAVAAPNSPAVITCPEAEGTERTVTSFAQLQQGVDRVVRGFQRLGVRPGDRVAMQMDQGVPALEVFIAALHMGAIAVPIPPTFGRDAVIYRLRDAGVKLLVVDDAAAAAVVPADLLADLPGLVLIRVTGDRGAFSDDEFGDEGPAPHVECAPTAASDPAIIFYTSGSTGNPKGVLHAHRLLLGHIPGFQLMFNFAPEPNDVLWTPSVWSWQGSLGDLVMPSMYFGCAVVASPGRFSVRRMWRVMREAGVTRAFMATAVLRHLIKDEVAAGLKWPTLRAICTGGDPLTAELQERVNVMFGVHVNDDYGLTETSHIAGGCAVQFSTPPGAIGRIMPGRRVAILDEELNTVPNGTVGQIVSSADDPITMLRYWGKPVATAERIHPSGWCLTSDLGMLDSNNILWFKGRMSLTIKVSGQAVGPEEIEACLSEHPDVSEVVVFGEPHRVKGEVPVAVVELVSGSSYGAGGSDVLVEELRQLAKSKLARFAYPERIVFSPIPRNSNGKVDRKETRAVFMKVPMLKGRL